MQQNEQQVGGGDHGGQTAAFSEQAAPGWGYDERPGYGPVQQNEQQVGGGEHGGQTAAFSEQAAPGYGYEPLHEEPIHVPSEEPSYEDASHAAAAEDPGGYAGHDGGADAGEVHHT